MRKILCTPQVWLTAAAVVMCSAPALAKLPPVSDEAKAKAAEAAAKTAWGNKVADFQLCKSMDRSAAKYYATMKQAGKQAKPPTETPPCADPGQFVYAPPGSASAPAAAPAVKPAAAPAKPAKKT